MLLLSTLHNKIFFSIDFEPKKFDRKLAENRKNRAKFFGSKSTEKKILLCKVDMRSKLYEIIFFELCSKKLELMKQIHLFKKGKFACSKKVSWYFSKGLRFQILLTMDYETTYPHQVVHQLINDEIGFKLTGK